MTATRVWRDWSCTVRVVVGDDRVVDEAARHVADLMGRVESAASRFREDSDLSRCNVRAGTMTVVSPLFAELVTVALEAADATGGVVDPTIGRQLVESGYDRDIAEVRQARDDQLRRLPTAPLPDWKGVRVDTDLGLVGVGVGHALDLGATAKAWTADRAAAELHDRYGCRVLVEIGGDLAVDGANDDPFAVRVAEAEGQAGEILDISYGGLATSTTTLRSWRSGRSRLHHIVDPSTGRPCRSFWRTASVWAPSALEANTASTAAIVLSDRAIGWLARNATAARLVDLDGYVRYLDGWPVSRSAA